MYISTPMYNIRKRWSLCNTKEAVKRSLSTYCNRIFMSDRKTTGDKEFFWFRNAFVQNLEDSSLHLRHAGNVISSDPVLASSTRNNNLGYLRTIIQRFVGETEIEGHGGRGRLHRRHGPSGNRSCCDVDSSG